MTAWTSDEIEILAAMYPSHAAEALAQILNKSPKAIRRKARTLNIQKEIHSPKNWRPIGSERVDRGLLIRKVTDTGRPKKDWKRVDVIEWETVHGPIPPGHTLMLKDSAKPRTLDNLALFTRASHWKRVTIQAMPPELMRLYQLKGQITQAVKRLEAVRSTKSENT